MKVLVSTFQKSYMQKEKSFKDSSLLAEQSLSSIKIVSAFGQEAKESDRFVQPLEKARKSSIRFHLFSSIAIALNSSMFITVLTVTMFIGSVFVVEEVHNDLRDRDYTTGDILAAFYAMMFAAFSLSVATPSFETVTKGKQAAYTAIQVIERKPEIDIDDENATRLEDLEGDIQFKDVSFQYKSRKIKALNNVSINFERGKTTALVGPSGSGKSTIVQLLERFYDPDEGTVLVDGQDLKTVNLRDFRTKVGYVGQEPVLFNQTIRENLRYGNPDATEEEMIKSLEMANAATIINKMPEGLDTVVGAQGGQLSGGEKQRIALARAFIKDPRILILDEATSALDRQNEEEVQKAIDNLGTQHMNITTIVVAHRLSTIKNSDKIIVLSEGKVVEEGTHKSLLKEYPDGIYSELVSTQEKLNDTDDNSNSEEDEDSKSDSDYDHEHAKKHTHNRKSTTFQEEVKNKKEEADMLDKELKESKEELYAALKKKGYFKRLLQYNKPYWLIAVGVICSCIQGMVMPVFGILYVKLIFRMFEKDMDDIIIYSLIMLGNCLISFTCSYFQKVSFGILAENMTKGIRRDLYEAILNKHIGWFDLPENSVGTLISTLTQDVYTLNGASTEGLSTIIETWFGIIGGSILALIFDWKTALVGFVLTPILILSSFVQVGLQANSGVSFEKSLKGANNLLSDAINNYKTVASFGNEQILIEDLKEQLKEPLRVGAKKAQITGLLVGWSNFIQNAMLGVLFYIGAVFVRYEGSDQEDVLATVFILMFAAWGVAQAQQFGPSQGKAMKSAQRIFSVIDEQSDIKVEDDDKDLIIADDKTFEGKIEFIDVWFRYPTRPDSWILKNFNLTVNSKEQVALVGESGSGKSTIVQLLLRFYEPHFGTILINGIDIKHYNLKSLRHQMGLVQQMPSLFNESVLYNI